MKTKKQQWVIKSRVHTREYLRSFVTDVEKEKRYCETTENIEQCVKFSSRSTAKFIVDTLYKTMPWLKKDHNFHTVVVNIDLR